MANPKPREACLQGHKPGVSTGLTRLQLSRFAELERLSAAARSESSASGLPILRHLPSPPGIDIEEGLGKHKYGPTARRHTRAKCKPNHFRRSYQVRSRVKPETESTRSTISSVYL